MLLVLSVFGGAHMQSLVEERLAFRKWVFTATWSTCTCMVDLFHLNDFHRLL